MKLYEVAKLKNLSIEELIVSVVEDDVKDEKLKFYIDVAKELIEEASELLKSRKLAQASEKIWGSFALIVKAHALKFRNRRLVSHGEIREYKDELAQMYGDWIYDVWNAAHVMHINFYEGFATEREIMYALEKVKQFLNFVINEVLKT